MMETQQEEIAKDRSLKRAQSDEPEAAEETTAFENLDEDIRLAITLASEKKAFNLIALDLRGIASFADFFVIAGGANARQVKAISDEINEQLKKRLKTKALRIEGYASGEWVLLDYGDFIVQIATLKLISALPKN